jgi:D-glycero-alpha-D-manno-heptose-7-phosphate kinase
MIISRTPYRISFFGGGTDYPVWYRENGGAVLGTSIDKFCYITCRYLPPFFEHKYRIVYSQVENVADINEIHHPSVKETLGFMGMTEGVEVHHDGDLPARTGIGSSSSFTVGLLHALYALKGMTVSKLQLAREAIHIEQDLIKEDVGSQDQVLAACGGLNRVSFSTNHTSDAINVDPVILPPERRELFQDYLMLFFTGFSRTASHIAREQIKETPNKKQELSEMQRMVDEAFRIITGNGDLLDLGRLMHESWTLKRSLTSKISTPYIDYVYETALNAGATGGKLIGAGGGGFILLFVDPEAQPRVKERLSGLLQVPFHFETGGSRIIFCETELQYEPEELMRLRGVYV